MNDRPPLPKWVRAQQAGGVLLALFAGFHAWAQWPALFGRDAWLARAQTYAPGPLVIVIVLALFAGHGVLGMARARGGRLSHEPRARFQAVTGVLLLAFLIVHVAQVWPRADGATAGLLRSYERLWALLGQPSWLVVYVVGCAALACHAAHGLLGVLELRAPQTLRVALRYAAGVSAFVLFVVYLQLVGRFAVGEAMLPMAAEHHVAALDPE
jgi:succinate dehydrogenase hydrophobic anchor subunit